MTDEIQEIEKNSIQRSPHDRNNPYVMTNRETIQDKRLSWQATGLLVYLLSLPSDWKIIKNELYNHKKNGRNATITAFNELVEHKYIMSIQLYKNNLKNGIAYYLYERPYDLEEEEKVKNCFRHTDFPFPENRLLHNKHSNSLNSYKHIHNKYSIVPPGPEPLKFNFKNYEFENLNEDILKEWSNKFEGIDIKAEILKSIKWIKSHQARNKKRKNWIKFFEEVWFPIAKENLDYKAKQGERNLENKNNERMIKAYLKIIVGEFLVKRYERDPVKINGLKFLEYAFVDSSKDLTIPYSTSKDEVDKILKVNYPEIFKEATEMPQIATF